jgi:hypothetical protein
VSTYWYFQCLDHTPPLGSDEFTQHTDDEDYQRGIALAAARPLDHAWWDGPQGTYAERNARSFLEAHPRCRLEAVSEYGDCRPLPSLERPETADEKVARLMWDSECTDEWTWEYLMERADRREGDYAEIRDMYLRMVAVARAALLQQPPQHPAEVEVEGSFFARDDLPDILARHMRALDDAHRREKQNWIEQHEQPTRTPSAEHDRRCASRTTMLPVDPPRAAACDCGATAKPVSVADMAPGTTWDERIKAVVRLDGLSVVDPSTIRDVTPPPAEDGVS